MKYLLLLLLMAASIARAEMPDDLLKGKTVEQKGLCYIDAKGMLIPERNKPAKYSPKCMVGSKNNSHIKTIAILNNDEEVVRIFEYNIETKQLKLLWSRKSV